MSLTDSTQNFSISGPNPEGVTCTDGGIEMETNVRAASVTNNLKFILPPMLLGVARQNIALGYLARAVTDQGGKKGPRTKQGDLEIESKSQVWNQRSRRPHVSQEYPVWHLEARRRRRNADRRAATTGRARPETFEIAAHYFYFLALSEYLSLDRRRRPSQFRRRRPSSSPDSAAALPSSLLALF